MKKLKNLLWIALAVVVIVVAVFSFTESNLEHIDDTNGDADFTLQTITDKDISDLKMGALNVKTRDSALSPTTYYSDKFTGVYEVYFENIITNRYEITVNHARVDKGNFKMVLCVDDEIVHVFTLNELTQTYVIENVSGTVSLRIAGESADFQFDYYTLN